MRITRLPAGLDSARCEIDIFALVFAFEPGREQAHQVHVGTTPPGKQFLYSVFIQRLMRQIAGQVVDDMPQMVQLALVLDMMFGAARKLDILLPAADFPQGGRHRPADVPESHGKDQRVPPRIVVKHHFNGGVGINPAIPVPVVANPDRGKRRRQGPGGHDVVRLQGFPVTVEVTQPPAADIHRTHGEACTLVSNSRVVDQFIQCFAQCTGAVPGGLADPGGHGVLPAPEDWGGKTPAPR